MQNYTKYILYLIPLTALALTLYYPGRALYYDILLLTEGVKVEAVCVHHEWKEDSEHEPEIITTNPFETAYPTVAFKYKDSIYVSKIDPYYQEQEDGTKSYLITGDSTDLIIFPDDPLRRPVVADGNNHIWAPLVTLIIFLIISIVLFVWIYGEVKNL